MKPLSLPLVLTGLLAMNSYAQENTAATLEEVIVTAEFRQVGELDLGSSVTVFSQRDIDQRGAVHLEGLLNLAPNVNFSSGASRGRFIQIRGIGERSQFVEPVNPSVGLVIDGMDFTGIGAAATLFDIQQVEILRGPQGTLFGANALAGLLNLVSNGPGGETPGRVELTVADYDSISTQAALGGTLGPDGAWRVAARYSESNGFLFNDFLGRPTNDIKEFSFRTRLSWDISDNLRTGFTLFHADIDNGYDAFSLDANRTTYSDEPGMDRLDALAGALTLDWEINDKLGLNAVLAQVNSDSEYGYDEDWSNPGICDGTPCDSSIWGFDWWYQSTDFYLRENNNTSLDLRLNSLSSETFDWTAGLYWREQDQGLRRDYTYAANAFDSNFDTETLAAYGQLDVPFAASWNGVFGLRWETRDWTFSDNAGLADPASDSEDFFGGKLGIEYRTDQGTLVYALASRGYKAGGFNTALASELADLEDQGIVLPEGSLQFGEETLWNYEAGLKGSWLQDRLALSLAVFYQQRDDMQVKQSIVITSAPGSDACPCTFIDSLQNAAGGTNAGIEVEGHWLVTDQWELFGSLGLLDTQYKDYKSFTHADADLENGIPFDLDGRSQAHAPDYQYALGGRYQASKGWFVQLDVEGKDGFYASASHEETLSSYTLFNARAGIEKDQWSIAAWVRNLGDENVQTRGFGGFGNDPRNFYQAEPYYQLGSPRLWGITAIFQFGLN